jgi:uncharacterized protein YjbI with pentapeptide repeats
MRRLGSGLAVGLVIGLLAGGGLVWATIPDSTTGTATACYATSGAAKGVLHVIDAQAGETCPAGEKKVALTTVQCSGYPRVGVDWRACDFHGANLDRQNLNASRLNGTNLGFATMVGVRLNASNLSGANLGGAQLALADLRGANITGANLAGAKLSPVPFSSSGYTKVSGLVGLTSAQVRSLPLIAPATNPCGVRGPDLRQIDFGAGFNASGIDLSGADLSLSLLPGANLSSANLTGALFNYKTSLVGANLSGADLTCAWLQGSFDGASFVNADLTDARMNHGFQPGVAFRNTDFTGAVFDNTTCPDGSNSDANGGTCVGHLTK